MPCLPSASISSTLRLACARASARAAATVVLPVPPLPVTTCSRTPSQSVSLAVMRSPSSWQHPLPRTRFHGSSPAGAPGRRVLSPEDNRAPRRLSPAGHRYVPVRQVTALVAALEKTGNPERRRGGAAPWQCELFHPAFGRTVRGPGLPGRKSSLVRVQD